VANVVLVLPAWDANDLKMANAGTHVGESKMTNASPPHVGPEDNECPVALKMANAGTAAEDSEIELAWDRLAADPSRRP
jgi:hypothetical protein